MTRRFALRQILPFAMAFLTLLVSAIAADFLLHQMARPDVGRQLGRVGAVLLLVHGGATSTPRSSGSRRGGDRDEADDDD